MSVVYKWKGAWCWVEAVATECRDFVLRCNVSWNNVPWAWSSSFLQISERQWPLCCVEVCSVRVSVILVTMSECYFGTQDSCVVRWLTCVWAEACGDSSGIVMECDCSPHLCTMDFMSSFVRKFSVI